MVMGCVCTWPTKTPQSPSHKAVLSTSGITRSGRSAKSGRPSTFGVELLPVQCASRTISRNHESSACISYDITEPREFSVHLARYHGTTRVQCASRTISRNHESSVCISYDITEPREFSVHLVRYHGITRVQRASRTISRNHESSACISYDITEPREFSVHLVRYHGTTRVQRASRPISRSHKSSAGITSHTVFLGCRLNTNTHSCLTCRTCLTCLTPPNSVAVNSLRPSDAYMRR